MVLFVVVVVVDVVMVVACVPVGRGGYVGRPHKHIAAQLLAFAVFEIVGQNDALDPFRPPNRFCFIFLIFPIGSQKRPYRIFLHFL